MTIGVFILITKETTFYNFPAKDKDGLTHCYLGFKLEGAGSLLFTEECGLLPPHKSPIHLDAVLSEEQIKGLTNHIDKTRFLLNQIPGSNSWSISVI
ncbi:MAG: hypothetical protein ACD_58C00217G0004 [uncultured bacterium]|nr:MAG: hypothetical protein ACD_58C00217G0004 [uncultured bacterium]